VKSKLGLGSICSERKHRGLSNDTLELIGFARSLLRASHPMTLRQLHYAIFSSSEIAYENSQASYKRLSRATTTARRAFRQWQLAGAEGPMPEHGIDPRWMIDETRQPEGVSVWTDAAEYAESVRASYRRDNWQTQQNHVEIWSEKATVLGSIRPIANKWGVKTRVCHGYGSCGLEMQVGDLFESVGAEKDITVLYIGDHDPSGDQMQDDIHGRAATASGLDFAIVRLAIHPEDIKKFKLPPQKIKDTDTRAARFRRKFGKNANTVELDALPVDELRRRLDGAIDELVDHEPWDRQLAVQEVELDCIREFAERLKKLPQIGGTG
jgi:hypothetical protein